MIEGEGGILTAPQLGGVKMGAGGILTAPQLWGGMEGCIPPC